jgi:phosphomannomutase
MTERAERVLIADLMTRTGVGFGTSGARGKVTDLTDRVCYAYTLGFLAHLETQGRMHRGSRVAVGGDLRPSTGRMMRAVGAAARQRGYEVENSGRLPSPALALHGLARGDATIMVTGSHIPADRNGIKYNTAAGEITKDDEAGIRRQVVEIPGGLFTAEGSFRADHEPPLPEPRPAAADAYVRRYLDAFPERCLAGLRVGLYEHSAVGRDLLNRILTGLGARVEALARSDQFLPVDTEAIREEDVALARAWAASGRFDALVSADGDSDRPLVGDERGSWLRGDVLGILVARFLGARGVAVPVSCNTALERCGAFPRVVRTRIGSPYVIEGMAELVANGCAPVVGYEANGGFLTASPIPLGDRSLAPLPTRDAVLPIVTALLASARTGQPLSRLVETLPARFTESGRLQNFPTEQSARILAQLASGAPEENARAFARAFGGRWGEVLELNLTDGARATLRNGDVVHLRPSGNAPEFRCYVEADSAERARYLLRECLRIMEGWRETR